MIFAREVERPQLVSIFGTKNLNHDIQRCIYKYGQTTHYRRSLPREQNPPFSAIRATMPTPLLWHIMKCGTSAVDVDFLQFEITPENLHHLGPWLILSEMGMRCRGRKMSDGLVTVVKDPLWMLVEKENFCSKQFEEYLQHQHRMTVFTKQAQGANDKGLLKKWHRITTAALAGALVEQGIERVRCVIFGMKMGIEEAEQLLLNAAAEDVIVDIGQYVQSSRNHLLVRVQPDAPGSQVSYPIFGEAYGGLRITDPAPRVESIIFYQKMTHTIKG